MAKVTGGKKIEKIIKNLTSAARSGKLAQTLAQEFVKKYGKQIESRLAAAVRKRTGRLAASFEVRAVKGAVGIWANFYARFDPQRSEILRTAKAEFEQAAKDYGWQGEVIRRVGEGRK